MKRIKRTDDLEITAIIHDDLFISTPRQHQRSWLVNRVLLETVSELEALHYRSSEMIPGGTTTEVTDRDTVNLDPEDIMEDWQIPIMRCMADKISQPNMDILEIGFGRGIASDMIQLAKPRSHTIIECNPHVIEDCKKWRSKNADKDIRIIEGLWQDTIDQLHMYDGIFFHAYPLNSDEYVESVFKSVTFAGNFFPVARQLLRPAGQFSYLSNEADSLSRAHQRLLFSCFDSFSLTKVSNLDIPDDTHDSHWFNEMVVAVASVNSEQESL